MNVVVGGWPGSGKTTVSSLLAREIAAEGYDALAIHNGQPTIGVRTLGLDPDVDVPRLPVDLLKRVPPVGGDADLELAKSAREIIDDYGVEACPGLTVLSVTTFDHLGSDCMCSGHVTVRKVLSTLMQDCEEVTVIDIVASIDQLPSDTLEAVDIVLVVVEPHDKSLEAGRRLIEHVDDLGIPDVRMLANKIRDDDHRTEIEEFCVRNEIVLEGFIPFDDAVHHGSEGGTAPLDSAPETGAMAAIRSVATNLLTAFAPDQWSRRPSTTEQ